MVYNCGENAECSYDNAARGYRCRCREVSFPLGLILVTYTCIHCSPKCTLGKIPSATIVHYFGSAYRNVRDSVDVILSDSDEQK